MKTSILSFVLATVCTAVSYGQNNQTLAGCRPQTDCPVIRPFFWAPGSGYRYHASTAAEGYWRGMADFVRAQAEWNLLVSQAMINAQEARRSAMENLSLQQDVTFKMQHANRAFKTQERQNSYQPAPVRLTKLVSPAPDDLRLVNQATGTLAWPAALKNKRYSAARASLEQLWQQCNSIASKPENQTKLVETARTLEENLKNRMPEISAAEYIAAKKFLEKLITEYGGANNGCPVTATARSGAAS
jgi:hypothetical protein